jgi:hypothetical protein
MGLAWPKNKGKDNTIIGERRMGKASVAADAAFDLLGDVLSFVTTVELLTHSARSMQNIEDSTNGLEAFWPSEKLAVAAYVAGKKL